jgi:hypothetical protein
MRQPLRAGARRCVRQAPPSWPSFVPTGAEALGPSAGAPEHPGAGAPVGPANAYETARGRFHSALWARLVAW